jgi:hypothetical protein
MILLLLGFLVHVRCYKVRSFLHISNALITFRIPPPPSSGILIHMHIRIDVGDVHIDLQLFYPFRANLNSQTPNYIQP